MGENICKLNSKKKKFKKEEKKKSQNTDGK